ncbi:MAG: epoxyqueuosine reductase QueH, partial [Candidatus Margulisbacteria bacterium]|nr:epoxyqueuosine reductase QueH [Candidatus Margulisiibacteriota bacterium]
FLFQDFNAEWEKADQMAIKMNLYEQPYCGCIYSECYRFFPATLNEFEKKQKVQKIAAENVVKKATKKKKSKARVKSKSKK